LLASIQFESYYLSKIEFRYSPDSTEIDEGDVSFSHSVEYLDSNQVQVLLQCNVTDEAGLKLEVEMNGIFIIEVGVGKSVEDPQIQHLCERNTLSILFPYLRSAISDISVKANIPPIILPTINILGMLNHVEEDMKRKKIKS
jgi:preprotein translocase subunit SecB